MSNWNGFNGVEYRRLNPGVCVSYTGFDLAMEYYIDFNPFNFKRPALIVHPDEKKDADDAMEMCLQSFPNTWGGTYCYTCNYLGTDHWMLVGENGIVVSRA